MSARAADTGLRRWLLNLAGDGSEIWQHTVAPWRSITFNGERHSLCMKLHDKAQVARLTSADLEVIAVPGALVVDATVTGLTCGPDHWWLFIELLTLTKDGHDAGAGSRVRTCRGIRQAQGVGARSCVQGSSQAWAGRDARTGAGSR